MHAVSPDGHAPSVATSHLRRSAVRMLFRALREHGVVDHDPTLDVLLPPRSSLRARPLTDDEIALGRSFSFQTLRDSRRPAAWALAEATVRTSELSQVTVADLDLEAGTVHIAGSTKTQPRVGVLSTWGVAALARRVESFGADAHAGTCVVYKGDGSLESRQASGCLAISDTLRRAGLAREPDVRPVSIAAWAGKKVFDETGQIEAAAHALGMRSLDRAAASSVGIGRAKTSRDETASRRCLCARARRGAARQPGAVRTRGLGSRAGRTAGGRPRDYPTYMWVLYEALISVYGSARRVEAELAHPIVWNLIRTTVRRSVPAPT